MVLNNWNNVAVYRKNILFIIIITYYYINIIVVGCIIRKKIALAV